MELNCVKAFSIEKRWGGKGILEMLHLFDENCSLLRNDDLQANTSCYDKCIILLLSITLSPRMTISPCTERERVSQ